MRLLGLGFFMEIDRLLSSIWACGEKVICTGVETSIVSCRKLRGMYIVMSNLTHVGGSVGPC